MTSEISLNNFIDTSRYSRITVFDSTLASWHWDLIPNPLRTNTYKDGNSYVYRVKSLFFNQQGDFVLTTLSQPIGSNYTVSFCYFLPSISYSSKQDIFKISGLMKVLIDKNQNINFYPNLATNSPLTIDVGNQ